MADKSVPARPYSGAMNAMPAKGNFDEELVLSRPYDCKPVVNRRFDVKPFEGKVIPGAIDASGWTDRQPYQLAESLSSTPPGEV